MTYYDVLGISRTAKDTEIKKAYHQMIIAFHPDTYQGEKQFAAKKTHEIIDAYKVLHNPATRKVYDEQLNSRGRNTPAPINKNTPTPAPRYQSRREEDTNGRSSAYSQKTKPKGVNKFIKTALIVIGIAFVVFAVGLFILIIFNIDAPPSSDMFVSMIGGSPQCMS